MLRNLLYSTRPVILHNPGCYPWWSLIVETLFRTQPHTIHAPGDLTIITWNNTNQKGVLEKSLDLLRLPYLVLGQGMADWKNYKKIGLTCEALRTIKTKYVLGMDSFDCVVVGDPKYVVQIMSDYHVDMLFNAETYTSYSSRNLVKICRQKFSHPFSHLNAGAWAGKTELCKMFFDKVNQINIVDVAHFLIDEQVAEHKYEDYFRSEQLRVKMVFERAMGGIGIDDRCMAFQALNEDENCVKAVAPDIFGYFL